MNNAGKMWEEDSTFKTPFCTWFRHKAASGRMFAYLALSLFAPIVVSGCGRGGGANIPSISIADASVAEGSTGGVTNLVFTVTLSATTIAAVTVDYATADGTALSTSDYTAANATLTIPANTISGTIAVLINADMVFFEPNETLTLTLSNPVNARLGTAVATGTILNDDPGGINDTGITKWGNGTDNKLIATQPLFPVQDADVGRDALARAGALIKAIDGGGKAGFDFTKLDAAGVALVDQAATYASTPWDCVLDHTTGLMWEVKTAANPKNLHDTSYTYSWYDSTSATNGGNPGTANGGDTCTGVTNCNTEEYVAAVNTAGLCGYKDWRLPKKDALRSIVDYGIAPSSPTIDTGYFPNATTSAGWFWSASPYAGNDLLAWGIDFNNGDGGTSDKSQSYPVRLVRGGSGQTSATQTCNTPIMASTPTADFIDNHDGTVTHTKTGLMWKRCSEGQTWYRSSCTDTATTYTWQKALDHAKAVNTAANFPVATPLTGWRVPNIKELGSIVKDQCVAPSLNATIFPATPSTPAKYWSASPYAGGTAGAWYVNFDVGDDGTAVGTSPFYVRLVRGGQ